MVQFMPKECGPDYIGRRGFWLAPESLPHSYLVASDRRPRAGSSALAPPVSVRVPKALQHVRGETGPLTDDLEDPAGHGSASPGAVSYQKVRRWEMLPKHAWLQAAEAQWPMQNTPRTF